MKKIKYLMPILGLSSIAVTAIPLSSCGNNTGDTGPVKPDEGGKSKETSDGTASYSLKFEKKPDGGTANASLTNLSETNPVQFITSANDTTSTTVTVGDDLKANVKVGFVTTPTESVEVKFNLKFTYKVDGTDTTAEIKDCVLKYNKPSITSISIDSSVNLVIGGTKQLEVSVVPTTASKEVTWSIVSGSEFITLSDAGLITATKKGTAKVIATSKVDTKVKSNECTVTVDVKHVESVTLDKHVATLVAGGDTLTLTQTVLPEDATDKSVKWETSDENKATVSNGVVTPLADGTVTITCTSNSDADKKDECVVTINKAITSITVSTTATAPYYASDSIQFSAAVSPTGAPTDVNWSVEPTEIGEIDTTGKFTAKKVGTCTIKATSKTQTSKFGTKEITISSILKTETESNSKILKGFVDGADFDQQVWKDRIDKEFGSTLTIPADINGIAANAFCTSGVSTIPSTITALDLSKTTALTCILYQAFMNAPFGGNVVIPNTVTVLGNEAFYGSKITGIQFPQNDTIKTNGVPSGFCNSCTSLSSVTIPSNYEKIASSAFYSTSALTSITLPTSLKTIGEYAFYQSHITNVVIPNTVTSIDQLAFGNINSGSGGIGSVDLSAFTTKESIQSLSVGSSAFAENSSSQKASFIIANDSLHETWQTKLNTNAGVTWGPNNWNISVCVNDYFDISDTSLKGFTTESTEEQIKAKTGDTLVIPNTITTIEAHSFYAGWTGKKMPSTITKLTFQKGSQLKYLGQMAFYASGIKDVYLPYTVKLISGDYFDSFLGLSLDNIKIEASEEASYTSRDSDGNEINTVYDKDWKTLIRATNNTDLNSLPSTLEEIERNALRGQKNLAVTNVTIPSSVVNIGVNAFYDSNITSLVVPASLTTTDYGSLSSGSITTIDMSAFAADCTGLLDSWNAQTFTNSPTSGTLYVNSAATTEQVTAWTTLLQSKGLPTSWTVQAKTSI